MPRLYLSISSVQFLFWREQRHNSTQKQFYAPSVTV